VLEARVVLSTVRFGVIGDYGCMCQAEADVAAVVKSWNPDLIITVGDNNYNSGAASTIDGNIGRDYHEYIGNYTGSYGAGSPTNRFFPSLGNHDWGTTSGSPPVPTPYLNYFTLPAGPGNERYYTFTSGPVQFFAIDSDPAEPHGRSSGSTQGQWLQTQLAASTAPWQVVYFHHTPYSSGSHGNDATMQWPFAAWGADVVLTGHDHTYERLQINGIPYIVNGLGGKSIYTFSTPVAGSQVRYNGNYGAMRVDANDTSMQFQFITRSGAVVDTYTLSTSSLPTVSVSASDADAAEPGANTGTFTVSRTGSTAAALTVHYTVNGPATNGGDYGTLTSPVTIPAGSASAPITVSPLNDFESEGTETVTLTLAPNALYNVGAANTATVTLADDDFDTLIPVGAVWKYLDNGSNQGTNWRTVGFNDGGWASGSAELGYGDNDEATVVSYGSNSSLKHITTYFRRAFNVTNAAAVTELTLRLLRDDGAVVYLNGVEVYRTNMPSGSISYTTLASSALGEPAEETFVSTSFSPTGLQTGNNVVAVEIHQANQTSSDISFNLELLAAVDLVPPGTPSTPILESASDTGDDDEDGVTADATPTFLGTGETGSTVKLFSDGVQVGSGVVIGGNYSVTTSTLSNGMRTITATAVDSSGNSSSPSGPLSILIDVTVPAAPVISGITTDTGGDPSDEITSDQTLVFAGTAEADSMVTLTRSGSGAIGTTMADLGGAWTFDDTATTLAAGSYSITATATDLAGNVSTASATLNVTVDTAAPTADVVDVSPDPRSTSVSQITINFNQAVAGFDLPDLQLARDGGGNLLTGSQTLTSSDGISWTLGNLSGLTGTVGAYTLTLTAAGSGISDLAGNSMTANAADTWQVQFDLTKFIVVDNSADKAFRYQAGGTFVSQSSLNSGNLNSRGVAASPDGSTLWVLDKNKKVFVYNAAMSLLGSWTANGLNTPTGIAVSGADVWIVDSGNDRAHRYAGAASRLSGSTSPTSFKLGAGNTNPQDIATDGIKVWVVHSGSPDRMYVYQASNFQALGNWTIDSANKTPTGLAIDPTGASNSLWTVDAGTDRVYEYVNGRARTSGSQSAGSFFALNTAGNNKSPQGIADPRLLTASAAMNPSSQVVGDLPVADAGWLQDFTGHASRRWEVIERLNRVIRERIRSDHAAAISSLAGGTASPAVDTLSLAELPLRREHSANTPDSADNAIIDSLFADIGLAGEIEPGSFRYV
jgi:hypothetical protein